MKILEADDARRKRDKETHGRLKKLIKMFTTNQAEAAKQKELQNFPRVADPITKEEKKKIDAPEKVCREQRF